ncbi:MAG: MAPEG family protein, partial [Alloalcanivorax xenomutans]
AYQNTLELLGVVIVIAGAAMAVGNDLAGQLLPWILAARIGQSLIHLIGVNHWLVQIRFAFLLVQMVLLAWLALDTFPVLCDLIKP